MKKTKITILSIALASTLSFTGCQDDLDDLKVIESNTSEYQALDPEGSGGGDNPPPN